MSRYPYTIACDALREIPERVNGISPAISRSDASRIRSFIAEAIGMDDHELARKIADHAAIKSIFGDRA